MVRKKLLMLGWCLLALQWSTASVSAQLQRDVREIFEGMLEDLDPDNQEKFEEALRTDSSSIEFTPEQFRRFRSNPANPFDGLENIKANGFLGNIVLKFDLPSLRERPVGRFERQSPVILDQLTSSLTSAAASTVKVFEDRRQVAMGVVVAADGWILTKASELDGHQAIQCQFSNGKRWDAKILALDSKNDLALLRIRVKGLTPIQWSEAKVVPGAFVLTPDVDGSAIALGSYSVLPRSTGALEQAFLGVRAQTASLGVRVGDIEPGTASFEAGLRNGDVVTRFGNVKIFDVPSLVNSIRERRPGDLVEIEFLRDGNKETVNATLAGRRLSGERAARFKMMNRLGAVPSRRNRNFPMAFQHDSPLFPEQCGGPITDLDGNVLGINIARGGRAASYAIPSKHVQTVLKHLMRDANASQD